MGFVSSCRDGKDAVTLLVLGCLLLGSLGNLGSDAERLLPEDEVRTLQTIFKKLQYKPANFTRTSCNDTNLQQTILAAGQDNGININCTCSSTVCHVTSIKFKGQNLAGVFPPEFGDLTFLKEMDLTRNYIRGPIPTTLSRLPLVKLVVGVNRISGRIPHEIGDIPTLEELVLEDNLLGGLLPPNLGYLGSLRRLVLSANNFTGTIPETFHGLKNLTDFRIDGSSLSGKIPELLGNWSKLEYLHLQGTSMEGPIPSTISSLKDLIRLRITDLGGSTSPFPNLHRLINLQQLVLKNCLIKGSIPNDIGRLKGLKILDLSSNMLSGPVPATLADLPKIESMFLTNNSLTGSVPQNIIRRRNAEGMDLTGDVSYNNFTQVPAEGITCSEKDVIYFSSFSSFVTDSIPWCLRRGLPCDGKAKNHQLFINCGGERIEYNRHIYEEDSDDGKGKLMFPSAPRWAYSNTGVAFGDPPMNKDRADSGKYNLNITGPPYLRTARTSPQSLKYYGLCMRRGSYKVKLHFAEISFSNDRKFSSLGRRIFDISIQGKLVKKDFNIAEKAGGVGKECVLTFDDIQVNGTTLEIHLHWSGKGTTSVPEKGVHGPLISAITVTPNFAVGHPLPAGAIAGISVSAVVPVIALVLIVLRVTGHLGRKSEEGNELLDLPMGFFTLTQIKAATNNFDHANKIGEGGFGPVYKGVLSDGRVIAVKRLSSKSKQGNREFVNELGTISALQHPNLVRLYGCCCEGKELLLVYEYLEKNCLARALFGPEEHQIFLDWPTRKRICLEIARGLAFLHEESRLKIVHRDIKATNVLLDADLHAKISDFGLAKLDDEENTYISTRIAGTIGYMAPEYAMRGHLTDKADVYSFGVVTLEIVSGKSNTNYLRPNEYLLDWAYVLQARGNLLDLADPALRGNHSKEEAKMMLDLALLCTNASPTMRPAMSSVVSMLEGKSMVRVPSVQQGTAAAEAQSIASELLVQDSQATISTFSPDSRAPRSQSTEGLGSISSAPVLLKDEISKYSSMTSTFSIQNEWRI